MMKLKADRLANYKAQSEIIKSLAHPTRLFLLDELSRGERAVQDLTEMVGVEMPTVSRHLSLLKSAGILEAEKRGAQVFYRIKARCALNVFHCMSDIQAARNH
jgi:ArsR family transcriptional regulator